MNLEEASELFQLIADPNRLTILKILTTKLHVCANDFLKEVSCKQSTLSHHLSEMVNANLLNSKKSGNKVFYSLNAKKYEALSNYLNKIDRINKTQVEPTKPSTVQEERPIRVVDSKIIKSEPVKKELPTFLL